MDKNDELETLSFNMMKVDPKTAEMVGQYLENGRTRAMTFQQMVIFCTRNSFNPKIAPFRWEDGQ